MLAGVVTDRASGAPLAGVTVSTSRSSLSSTVFTTTDADGRYELTGEQVGTATGQLVFQAEGYYASLADYEVTLPLPATLDADLLVGGPVVEGTVRDAVTGSPVASAVVRWSTSSTITARTGSQYLVTDSSGRYRIDSSAVLETAATGFPFMLSVSATGYLSSNAGFRRDISAEPPLPPPPKTSTSSPSVDRPPTPRSLPTPTSFRSTTLAWSAWFNSRPAQSTTRNEKFQHFTAPRIGDAANRRSWGAGGWSRRSCRDPRPSGPSRLLHWATTGGSPPGAAIGLVDVAVVGQCVVGVTLSAGTSARGTGKKRPSGERPDALGEVTSVLTMTVATGCSGSAVTEPAYHADDRAGREAMRPVGTGAVDALRGSCSSQSSSRIAPNRRSSTPALRWSSPCPRAE